MSLVPAVAGVSLAPLAVAAGGATARVATDAATGFLNLLRTSWDRGAEWAKGAAGQGAVAATAVSEGAGALNLAELRETLGRLLASFRSNAGQSLDDQGVALDRELLVRTGDAGRLELCGDHPERPAIESALNGSPLLADLFAAIVENTRRLAAATSELGSRPDGGGSAPVTVPIGPLPSAAAA